MKYCYSNSLDSYPSVLWQVRELRFGRHHAVPLPQDHHHQVAATHLGQTQLRGSSRLLLCHSPPQLHLLQVEAVGGSPTSELGKDTLHQDVPLCVHVSEGGGDEDANTFPPEVRNKEGKIRSGKYFFLI